MDSHINLMSMEEVVNLLYFIAMQGEGYASDENNFVYLTYEDALLQVQVHDLTESGFQGYARLMITAYPDSNIEVPASDLLKDFCRNWNEKQVEYGAVLCGICLENRTLDTYSISGVKFFTSLKADDFFDQMSILISEARMLNDEFLKVNNT